MKILSGALCDVCGLPQDVKGICDACRADRPHFRALRARSSFDDPVKQALHKLKYYRDFSMGQALAAHMTGFAKSLNWNVDMMIPIPLGRQRMKERGYNQAGMVADPLAMALDIEFAPKALMRFRETRSQVGLSKLERQKNVLGAFQAAGVSGKTILILDDVLTTGSTLSASAEALLLAGAKDVYALTVARALPHHGLKHV